MKTQNPELKKKDVHFSKKFEPECQYFTSKWQKVAFVEKRQFLLMTRFTC